MSAALVLDLALVALIIGRAFAGWRVGALVSLLGLVGVVAGALAGWWLAPQLLARAQLAAAGYAQTLAMMAILLVGALVGEWVGARVGAGLRRHNSSRVGRFFDALLGSVSAVLVVAFVLWFVGAALRPMLPVAWARTLNSSTMLAKLDSWCRSPCQRGRPGHRRCAARVAAGVRRPDPEPGLRPRPGR